MPPVHAWGSFIAGTLWLARGCSGGDGILRGAGQSRQQAMRCKARVAFVFIASI